MKEFISSYKCAGYHFTKTPSQVFQKDPVLLLRALILRNIFQWLPLPIPRVESISRTYLKFHSLFNYQFINFIKH